MLEQIYWNFYGGLCRNNLGFVSSHRLFQYLQVHFEFFLGTSQQGGFLDLRTWLGKLHPDSMKQHQKNKLKTAARTKMHKMMMFSLKTQ